MKLSVILSVLAMTFFGLSLNAQDIPGIMTILGIREEESLSEQVMEHFENLSRNPVEINLSSAQRLLSTGLFSQYQVASLLDYRSSYGDVLSIEELSSIDGFGHAFAQALRPYVSLFSKALPGQTGRPSLNTDVTLRSTWKQSSATFRGKVVMDYGSRASASFAGNCSGDGKYGYTFHGAVSGRRHLDCLVVGDFNARFGQGLTLWSGFSLSGMAAPSSLYRRPAGITPSTSYSGTGLRGIAVQSSWGRFCLSALAGLSSDRPASDGDKVISINPGFNLGYLMKYGQISVSGTGNLRMEGSGIGIDMLKAGVDARFCLKGTDIFGEIGSDLHGMSLAGLGGVVFRAGETARMGFVGRFYPRTYSKVLTGAVRSGTYARDEAGVSISYERKGLVLCTDLYRKLSSGRDQVKFVASDEITIGGLWSVKPKISARYRRETEADIKTEVRTDICWNRVPWSQTLRVDWMRYVGNAFLAYYEAGLQKETLTAYLRATVFHIDNWDDRIYSYERDAPGNFNVPAYYGRGFSLNMTGAWKPRMKKGRLKLYLGLYYKDTEKPGKSRERTAGLRFQSVLSF